MRAFKPVTITVRADILEKIKSHCKEINLPVSRFMSMSAVEKINEQRLVQNTNENPEN